MRSWIAQRKHRNRLISAIVVAALSVGTAAASYFKGVEATNWIAKKISAKKEERKEELKRRQEVQKKYQEVLRKEGKTIETQLEELRGNQTFDEFTAEWQKLLTELNANNESFLKFVEPREKAIRAKTLAASRAAKRKNLTELKDVLSSEMSYLGTVSKHFNNLMRIVAEFKSVIKDYDLNRKFSGKVNDEIADDLQDFVGEVGDFSDETIALVNSCIKSLDMKDPVHRQIYDLLLNHLDNILAELSNLNKNLKPFGKSLDKQISKINQYKQSILNMSLRQ